MLVEFTVGNFRSFRDLMTISLEATSLRARDPEVDEHNVFIAGGVRLLHVAAVYGANASGKSNLLLAIAALRDLVLDSARGQEGDVLAAEPFRLGETVTEPCHLEVVFLSHEHQYRYGVAFTSERVVREWLYRRAARGRREHCLFARNGDQYEQERFEEGRDLVTKTRSNALHLSVCAQFNGPVSKEVVEFFVGLEVSDGVEDARLLRRTTDMLRSPAYAVHIRELVQRLDVGISGLEVEEKDVNPGYLRSMEMLPERTSRMLRDALGASLISIHRSRRADGTYTESPFRGRDESQGTLKLIALSGPIIGALLAGSVLVLDEFDARLHPVISRELVRMFQDPATNPRHAQLVFTTHDTNLLSRSLFRRDQIWFVEKHPDEQFSDLYSLAELRDDAGELIRNDASFEPDYLQGRYGAVPFVGNLALLLGNSLHSASAEAGSGRSR